MNALFRICRSILPRLFVALSVSGAVPHPTRADAAEAPRLAVVISIDQFRADYLERFRPHFVAGGFKRLLEGGMVYSNAHYRHALTATAPGHATLLTGVGANVHGIIANDWLDPESWKLRGAIADPDAPLVGAMLKATRSPGGVLEGPSGASPRRLLATTVGDQMKLRHGTRNRVVSIANKDRAAILLGGHFADAAYWVEDGRFVTSRFYRDTLPDWVAAFNAEQRVEKAFGHVWDRLLDAAVYDQVQGPDNAPGEEIRLGLGATFPRVVNGGRNEISPLYYDAFRLVPAYSELLGDFVKTAIRAEELGRHEATDLLCIGFSQIDYLGHSYGPDSHEMMDGVLRLDRVIAGVLSALDEQVGVGRYVVVLSADHAVCPLPERIAALGRDVPSGRLDWPKLNAAVEDALVAAFGKPADGGVWSARDSYGYRLRRAALLAGKIDLETAAQVIKATVLQSPQIADAWTRAELTSTVATQRTPHLDAWRLSFNAERSPDVQLTPQPYFVDRSPAGANHGTPYAYDNHVPLLWYGTGVPSRVVHDEVGIDALAPTLSALLQVPRPPEARGQVLF